MSASSNYLSSVKHKGAHKNVAPKYAYFPSIYEAPPPEAQTNNMSLTITGYLKQSVLSIWRFFRSKKLDSIIYETIYPRPKKLTSEEYQKVQAQHRKLIDDLRKNNSSGEEKESFDISKVAVETHDNAHLDTLQILYREEGYFDPWRRQPPLKRQFIVYFPRYDLSFDNEQFISEIVEDVKTLKCNAISFDFRGRGLSVGKTISKDNFITDGIAQVQRLLDCGIDPENITVNGGAIATLVAKHFHDHEKKINLFNNRGFSSTTNLAVGRFRAKVNQESFFGRLLRKIVESFYQLRFMLNGCEIDAASAYQALPDTHKEYMVVRSPKKLRNNKIKDDVFIPHSASLHKALKREQKKSPKVTYTIHYSDHKPRLEKLEKQKDNRRKMISDFPQEDAHHAPMDRLHSRKTKKNACNFFRDFVKAAHEHHEAQKSNLRVTIN